LRGQIKDRNRRDLIADELRDLIYSGTEAMPAARDLPDLIMSVGTDYLLASEDDVRRDRYRSSRLGVELDFGIKEGRHHDSYPATAIRGPWIHLLWYHPREALDFFIKVFNHSVDWYAHPRLHDRLEPPWEVELTFADGTTRTQWANARLWGLYRGMTVGPYVLQSMLMALEKWLLELAEERPEELDAILLDILGRSDSAALSAVVASVAAAYPHDSGEALLVLLSARDYVELDRSRVAGDRQVSGLSGMLPTFRVDHQVYEAERKKANAVPHRGHHVETAIANLQLGPLAPRVHAILDRHLAVLRPKERKQIACGASLFTEWTCGSTPFPRRLDQKSSPQRAVRLSTATCGSIPNRQTLMCRQWSTKVPSVWRR